MSLAQPVGFGTKAPVWVLDASIALKWFFRDVANEAHTQHAARLLQRFVAGRCKLCVPLHFHAEVCAVLARKAPQTMLQDWADLMALHLPVANDPALLAEAMALAQQLDHHLFDTLYHALALATPGAVLLTADEAYARKAEHLGSLMRLQDYPLTEATGSTGS